MDRGSTTYGKGRLGTRLTAWDMTDDTDSGYVTKTGKYRDHVCRPVIVDPDGTMRPAIEFIHEQKQDIADPLVSKIEALMEHMEPPAATLQMPSSDTNNAWGKPSDEFVEKAKHGAIANVQTGNSGLSRTGFLSGIVRRHTPNSEYSSNNDNATNTWSRRSDTTDDTIKSGWGRPSSRTTDFGTNGWGKPVSQTYDSSTNGWSRPGSGTSNTSYDGWIRPGSGTSNTSYDGWIRPGSGTSNTSYDGWNRPGTGTSNTSYDGWSKPSGGTYDTGHNGWGRSGTSTYDAANNSWIRTTSGTYDNGTYGWSKPTGTTLHHPDYDDSYGKHGSMQKSGWSRPHHVSWATPTSYEIPPSKTSDVDNRNDYVREPMRLQSPAMTTRQGLFSTRTPTYPRKETVVETIDSKEASRRYGSLPATTHSSQENYSTTIDSREAARKYSGSFV